MKNNKYKVLSKLRCPLNDCPTVVQNGDNYMVIGYAVNENDTADFLNNSGVGINPDAGEVLVRVPASVIEEAAQKIQAATTA